MLENKKSKKGIMRKFFKQLNPIPNVGWGSAQPNHPNPREYKCCSGANASSMPSPIFVQVPVYTFCSKVATIQSVLRCAIYFQTRSNQQEVPAFLLHHVPPVDIALSPVQNHFIVDEPDISQKLPHPSKRTKGCRNSELFGTIGEHATEGGRWARNGARNE